MVADALDATWRIFKVYKADRGRLRKYIGIANYQQPTNSQVLYISSVQHVLSKHSHTGLKTLQPGIFLSLFSFPQFHSRSHFPFRLQSKGRGESSNMRPGCNVSHTATDLCQEMGTIGKTLQTLLVRTRRQKVVLRRKKKTFIENLYSICCRRAPGPPPICIKVVVSALYV